MRVLFAVLALIVIATFATGTEYVYYQGYYWQGNDYYRYYPAYYQYGRYYPGSYTYVGTYTPPVDDAVAVAREYANLRLKYDKAAVIVATADNARKVLFPEGLPKVTIGYGGAYATNHSYYNTQSQGSYTFNQQVPQVDVNVLLQGLQRTSETVIQGGISLQSGLKQTADATIERQMELERLRLAVAIAQGGPKGSTQSGVIRTTPVSPAVASVQSQAPQSTPSIAKTAFDDLPADGKLAIVGVMLTRRCGECHGGTDPKRIDIAKLDKLDHVSLQDLANRITGKSGDEKFMPRKSGGGKGESLSADEINQMDWYLNYLDQKLSPSTKK